MHIDEYGHIIDDRHNDDVSNSTGNIERSFSGNPVDIPVKTGTSFASVPPSRYTENPLIIPVPWYGHSGFSWTVTLGLVSLFAGLSYVCVGLIVGDIFSESNFSRGIGESIEAIASGIISAVGHILAAISTYIGCFIYNTAAKAKRTILQELITYSRRFFWREYTRYQCTVNCSIFSAAAAICFFAGIFVLLQSSEALLAGNPFRMADNLF